MNKFSCAFAAGRLAAKDIQLAHREIDEVFRQLKEEILEATHQKIEIYLAPVDEHKSILLGAAQRFAEGESVPLGGAPQKFYVTARNNQVGPPSALYLAKLTRPFEGFPCDLAFSMITERCHDVLALTFSLQGMLSNAWVAKRLVDLENSIASKSRFR